MMENAALTHWGRVTHICVSKLIIIGSDNGLSPSRRQAIIWTNAGMLLIRPSGTNFSEILIEIDVFSFKKMHLKLSSAKWRPFCLGLNVLKLSHYLAVFWYSHGIPVKICDEWHCYCVLWGDAQNDLMIEDWNCFWIDMLCWRYTIYSFDERSYRT